MASSTSIAPNTDEEGVEARIPSDNPPRPHDHDDGPSLEREIAPRHPLPFMQAAFEESIIDSTTMAHPDRVAKKLNAEARRQQILELEDAEQACSSRWTQQAGAKFHPLWKLVAQISFGVHLLHKNLAKSEEEVIRILQRHVDEVDSFAEDTTADYELAIKDIKERIHCLLLPLEHSHTFNSMLCDKTFRTSILEGNDIIERVIQRTRSAMEYSLNDVSKGLEAVVELAKYLDRLWADWPNQHHDLIDAYHVMRGNAEGWYRCFRRLQTEGDQLSDLLTKLESILDEVALRAGIASRRKTPTGVVGRKKQHIMATETTSSQRPISSSSLDRRRSIDKALPPPPSRRHSHSPHKFASMSQPGSPTTQYAPGIQSPALSVKTQIRHVRAASSPLSPTQPSSPQRVFHPAPTRVLSPVQMEEHRPSTEGAVGRTSTQTTTSFTSPIESLPSITADSGYSSCPETPALSPESTTDQRLPRRSLSVASTATLPTPQSPPRRHVHPLEELCEEMSDFHMAELPRRNSNGTVTALPIFKATPAFMMEAKKQTVLKKSNGTMRSLFATKKPSRRDVSGGVGGCVIIT